MSSSPSLTSSGAGGSKFLAYLEKRRSLTASQAGGIAQALRDSGSASAVASPTEAATPSSSTPSSCPSPLFSPYALSPLSSASCPAAQPPVLAALSPVPAPDSLRASPPSRLLLPTPTPQSASEPHPFSFRPRAADEHKEPTVLLLRATGGGLLSSSSPAVTPSYLASSLLQREMSEMRLRLQSAEEERQAERRRLEALLQSAQADSGNARKEAELQRERLQEVEAERDKAERDRAAWRTDREAMQRELDRMAAYMKQVAAASAAGNAALSSSLASSAVSHSAQLKEAAEVRRLKQKINRLIDEVGSKTAMLQTQQREAEAARERLRQAAERTAGLERELREMEPLRREVRRLQAFEEDWSKREAAMREIRRARAFYSQREQEMTALREKERAARQVSERLQEELRCLRDRTDSEHGQREEQRVSSEQWTRRCDEAERRAEAATQEAERLRAMTNYQRVKIDSTQREMQRLMRERGVDAAELRRDLHWLDSHSERRETQSRVEELQRQVDRLNAQLQQKQREEEEEADRLTQSAAVGVTAEQAATAVSPSPPPPPSSATKRRKKKRGVGNAAAAVSSSPSRPRRRATLPPQRNGLIVTAGLPAASSAASNHQPALKQPLRAIHTVNGAAVRASSSLTSTGSRVRFAEPASEAPPTPTFRFKQAFLSLL